MYVCERGFIYRHVLTVCVCTPVQVGEVTRLLERVSRRTEQVKIKHDVILSASTRDDGEFCAFLTWVPIRQGLISVFLFLNGHSNRCVEVGRMTSLSGYQQYILKLKKKNEIAV